MGRIIAISNQKGGVGKTTTAINLSACLAEKGKKVLTIDMDPQGNTTSGLGIDKNEVENTSYELLLGEAKIEETITKSIVENLVVIPSERGLSGAEIELIGKDEREYILKKEVDRIRDDYDFIIIDTNPSLDNLPINALTASDKVIITVQAEPYGVEGMADLLKSINMVKRNLNPDLKIDGILITMTDERTNLSKKIIQDIHKNFGQHIKIFNSTIPRCVKASESTGVGESIFVYDPKGSATKAYNVFTKEVILNAEKEHKRHKNALIR